MTSPLRPLSRMPEAQFVMSSDGDRIATYSWGPEGAPTVLAVHGFASNCRDNWVETGWVRDLLAAGFRVLGVDQLGHGQSDKPHDPGRYTMRGLVANLLAVLDTHLVDTASYLGYSLGARVGWQLMGSAPEHVTAGVLGGIPDGRPLTRLRIEQAQDYLDEGRPIPDSITRRYIALAERLGSNDVQALLALAAGMRLHDDAPPVERPPAQPTLIATGTDDPILPDSRLLAAALPDGSFFEIPGRGHVNAPTSRDFRRAGVEFFRQHRDLT